MRDHYSTFSNNMEVPVSANKEKGGMRLSAREHTVIVFTLVALFCLLFLVGLWVFIRTGNQWLLLSTSVPIISWFGRLSEAVFRQPEGVHGMRSSS